MKEVPLTKGMVALVDDEDYEWLMQWKWYFHSRGYAARNSEYKGGKRSTILMHRAIIQSPVVDHCDMNKLNNQRSNLRPATHAQNHQNTRKQRNTYSQYKGVSWNKLRGKWFAQINSRHIGKKLHLGVFEDEAEAARAYDKAAKEFFGDFARTNF